MKKSLIAKILAGVLGAAVVSVGTAAVVKGLRPAPAPDITAGYTVMLEPPKDDSLPTEHTGLENIAYMAYTLNHTKEYRVEAFSTVNTAVGFISYEQKVETYKDYKDGVMVVTDIARSSLVNTAMQSCFVSNRVLWRDPASTSPKNWNGRDTEWKEDEPANYSVNDYMQLYGLSCTEFSVYVLNETTLTQWSDVTDNGDGTYSQTYYPDTQTAGQYYIRRMKTMGGLTDYPSFNSIRITYTFDGDWKVLSGVVEENYAIEMSVIKSDNCNAVTEHKYTYGDADISAYDDFFSKYEKNQSTGDIDDKKGDLTAADYLSSAFSAVLVAPVQFETEISAQDLTLTGKVYLDLRNIAKPEVRVSFAGMNLWFSGNTLYLRAGDNIFSFTDEYIKDLLQKSGVSMEGITAALDFDKLLAQLGEGELTVNGSEATLVATLEIGSAELPLTFSFRREGEAVALNYVALTGAQISGSEISAKLSYDEGGKLSALTKAEKASAVNAEGYIDGVIALSQARYFDIDVSYAAEEITMNAAVTLDKNELTLSGTYDLSYNFLSLSGVFSYADEWIYLTVERDDGEPLCLRLNASEALKYFDVTISDLPDGSELSMAELLKKIGEADWKEIVPVFAVTDENANATIDVKGLLSAFASDMDIPFDEIDLKYTSDGEFSASANGLTFGLKAGETAPQAPTGEYKDATPLLGYIDGVKSLVNAEAFDFVVEYGTDDVSIELNATLNKADMTAVGTFEVESQAVSVKGDFIYKDEFIYLTVEFGGETLKMKLNVAEAFDILAKRGAEVDLSDLSINIDKLIESLTITEEKVTAELPVSFGEKDLRIALEYSESGRLNVGVKGVTVAMQAGTVKTVDLGDEAKYKDATPLLGYIDGVKSLVNAEAFAFNVNYNSKEFAFALEGTFNIKDMTAIGAFEIESNVISAEGSFIYKNNYVYLTLESGDIALKLKLNVAEALNMFVGQTGEDTLKIDWSAAIKNIEINDQKTITYMPMWLNGVKSYIDMVYRAEGTFKLQVLGAWLNVTAGEPVSVHVNTSEYKDATPLLGYIDGVKSLVNAEALTVSAEYAADNFAVELNATLNKEGMTVVGSFALDYDNSSVIGNFVYAEGDLYLSLSGNEDTLKLKLNVNEALNYALGKLFDGSVDIGDFSVDIDGLINNLKIGKEKTITNLPVSFGENDLSVTIEFTKDGELNIEIAGVSVNMKSSEAKTVSFGDKDEYKDITPLLYYIDGTVELIQSKAFTVSAGYQTEDMSFTLNALFDLQQKTLSGTFAFTQDDISLNGNLIYKDRKVYLVLNRTSGNHLKLYVDVNELSEALLGMSIDDLLALVDGMGDAGVVDFDFATIIDTLRFANDEASFTLPVGLFGSEIARVNVTYTQSGSLTAKIGNVSVGLSSGEEQTVTVENESDYTNATNYLPFFIVTAINKCANISGTIDLNVSGVNVALHVTKATIDWSDGFTFYVKAQLEAASTLHDLQLRYDGETFAVVYGRIGVQIQTNQFEDAKQALLNVYEKIAAYYQDAAKIEGEAAEQITGLTALSALFTSDEVNALLNSIVFDKNEEEALRIAFKFLSSEVNIVYGEESVNISASGATYGKIKASIDLDVKSGSFIGSISGKVTYIGLSELETICDYVIEVFEASVQKEWNIGYAMTVNNADETFKDYNGVEYNVSGAMQIIPADENAGTTLAASLDLDILATNYGKDATARNYFIDFTVKDGWLYIKVSYYASAEQTEQGKTYDPLYLKGDIKEMSSVLDTLKTVLGYDLPFLDKILAPFVSAVESGMPSLDLSKPISKLFNGLTADQTGVRVTVDNNSLYETNDLDDLALSLLHSESGNLTLCLDKLYYRSSAPLAYLNASFELLQTPCEVIIPAGEYIDVSTVDNLLQTLLADFFKVENNAMDLLDGYYFAGALSINIARYEFDFGVEANMFINNGEMLFNVAVSTESNFVTNDGKCKTWITFDMGRGMVYMTREQYEYYNWNVLVGIGWKRYEQPKVTYRAMTTEEFGDDYWNQIVYITNMSGTISSVVKSAIDNSSADTGIDYRNDVGGYLKGYSYSESSNAYSVTLNGKNFASFLGDMKLTLACNEEHKITNISGTVNIYIDIGVSLDYENVTKPNGDYSLQIRNVSDAWGKAGYNTIVSTGHTSSVNSFTEMTTYVSELTLKDGEKENKINITYGAVISALEELSDTDAQRFMGWYTGEKGTGVRYAAGAKDDGLGGKTLYAYWVDKITVSLDAQGGTLETDFVFDIPQYMWNNLAALVPEKAGFRFVGWFTEDGVQVTKDNAQQICSNGNITLHAEYKELITLTLTSEIAADGFTKNGTLYQRTAEWAEGETLSDPSANGYVFLGWWYQTDDGEWRQVTASTSLSGITELKSMWISTALDVKTSFSISGKTAKVSVNAVSPVFVSSEIKDKLTSENSFVYTFKGKKKVLFWEEDDSATKESASATASHSFGSKATSASVKITVIYKLNGKEVARAEATKNS